LKQLFLIVLLMTVFMCYNLIKHHRKWVGNMKKTVLAFFFLILFLVGCGNSKLPKPEVSDGFLGTFGIDKNINNFTIDKYLGREDTVYRDMRMLVDPADYEKIGGDRFLSGYIKGFQVIPYPYLAPVLGLPEEVGPGYQGRTLFRITEDGNYLPNYEESFLILEEIFPKDKNIFVMCGGGGYAMMTKNMLIKLGWDPNKIWNVGCYWHYEGENDVVVKEYYDEDKYYYAFHRVEYLVIDFDSLAPLDND
jgi:rhodanese-related sulfurtransferase